jgi:hypothetical protein
MLPGTVGRLLTVAMFAHLASGQGAETTVPNCANRRIQYLTDAEYNTNVAPFIMADIEYMCGEGCNDPAVEECRSYTTVSANTMMQISLDWPRKPENPGPADCVGAFVGFPLIVQLPRINESRKAS